MESLLGTAEAQSTTLDPAAAYNYLERTLGKEKADKAIELVTLMREDDLLDTKNADLVTQVANLIPKAGGRYSVRRGQRGGMNWRKLSSRATLGAILTAAFAVSLTIYPEPSTREVANWKKNVLFPENLLNTYRPRYVFPTIPLPDAPALQHITFTGDLYSEVQTLGDPNAMFSFATLSRQRNIELLAPKKVTQVFAVMPHNTPTVKSLTLPVLGAITTPNQYHTLQTYIELCQQTGVCQFDIDMARSGDTLTSKHGGSAAFRFMNSSDADTATLLEIVTSAAATYTDVLFSIRVQNDDAVGPVDISRVLSTEAKSRFLSFPKNAVPTVQDALRSGKNIMMFLQNDLEGLQSSGVYTSDFGVMAQSDYFLRSRWDVPSELIGDAPIDSYLTDNTSRLDPAQFGVLLDFYYTTTGANTAALPSLPQKIPLLIEKVFPKIQNYCTARGLTKPTSFVAMIDFVSNDSIQLFSAYNHAANITNPQTYSLFLNNLHSDFPAVSQAFYNTVSQKTGFVDAFIRIFSEKGAPRSSDISAIAPVSLLAVAATFAAAFAFFKTAQSYVHRKGSERNLSKKAALETEIHELNREKNKLLFNMPYRKFLESLFWKIDTSRSPLSSGSFRSSSAASAAGGRRTLKSLRTFASRQSRKAFEKRSVRQFL